VVLGFTLGIIYLVLLLVFAVLSFRKGHWVLGLIGFIFPVLWIIGAILPSRYARRLYRPGLISCFQIPGPGLLPFAAMTAQPR
jgi:hypothetical protein